MKAKNENAKLGANNYGVIFNAVGDVNERVGTNPNGEPIGIPPINQKTFEEYRIDAGELKDAVVGSKILS